MTTSFDTPARPTGRPAPGTAERATERPVADRATTLAVPVAAFCCLVVALQQTLVVPAVPRLPGLLGTSPQLVSWLVTVTLLTGAVTTPVFGRLADLFGKRRMLLVSMAFVLVGSVLAPWHGIETLLVGRALQGVGTALVPVAMAQLRDVVPGPRIGGALALVSAMLGVGGSVGIPLGGVMLGAFGWESLFWLSAALAVVSLALIALVMPADRVADRGTFDAAGAVLLSAALVALLLAVSQGGSWGWTSTGTLVSFALAVVLLLGWGRLELRHPSPLVDLRTTAHRALALTDLASLLLGVLMFTNLLLTTLRLQNPASEGGFGWSAASAGLAMIPTAVSMLVVAWLTAALERRIGARGVLVVGAVVTAVAYAAAVLTSVSAAVTIVWTTVISAGVGLGYGALPILVVQHAPAREAGSANGVNALLRAIGTAIGSALVSAMAAAQSVTVAGRAVPTAGALALVGTVGAVVAVVTAVVGSQARP